MEGKTQQNIVNVLKENNYQLWTPTKSLLRMKIKQKYHRENQVIVFLRNLIFLNKQNVKEWTWGRKKGKMVPDRKAEMQGGILSKGNVKYAVKSK